ncbi:30S ribosome-binding factor RbfA [Gephyromycinifex aptenodytis]|uniref:30S ribosome-binding factor RbfA n=1 Tax=Gephyromycinifex aptenodytis TaxID=2716227 RepID=UPI0038560E60
MSDPARARKVADRIKVIVAEMLERRIKDERLGFVTVTDVRVTGDLQHASIFYTVLGSEQDRSATAEALADNRGRIRSAVGKGLQIRLTPSIEFIPDAIPEGAAHLEEVIAVAKERDAELAARAAGATFAGEADPYRRPEDAELDDDELDAIDDEEPSTSELAELDTASEALAQGDLNESDLGDNLDQNLAGLAAVSDAEEELPRTLQAEEDALVDDAPDDELAEEIMEEETYTELSPAMQDELGASGSEDDRRIDRELAEEEPTSPELAEVTPIDGDEDVPTDLAGDPLADPSQGSGPLGRA